MRGMWFDFARSNQASCHATFGYFCAFFCHFQKNADFSEGRKHNIIALRLLRASIEEDKADDATFGTILALSYSEVSVVCFTQVLGLTLSCSSLSDHKKSSRSTSTLWRE